MYLLTIVLLEFSLLVPVYTEYNVGYVPVL